MKLRRLGDSDLEVSEISLGSWLTYSGGVERDQTEACTRAAFDAGINFFDTANAYGTGAAETAWGEILSGLRPRAPTCSRRRSSSRCPTPTAGSAPSRSHKQIDASLERLQTDYVDLYQCHRFDSETPIEETMEALTEVVEAGKARYIGFSEWTPEQIGAGLEVEGAAKFVSSQPQYNVIWRAPEAEVFAVCAENGISQIVWSPLAQGVLTGKYEPGEPPPAGLARRQRGDGRLVDRYMEDETLEAVQRLAPIADEAGLTMAQLALAWVLRRDEVASAIVGASRPEQVAANAAASGVELSADTLAAIDEALGDVIVTGRGSRATPRRASSTARAVPRNRDWVARGLSFRVRSSLGSPGVGIHQRLSQVDLHSWQIERPRPSPRAPKRHPPHPAKPSRHQNHADI